MSKWTAKLYPNSNGIYTIENEHGATVAKVGDKVNAERIALNPELYKVLKGIYLTHNGLPLNLAESARKLIAEYEEGK